MGGWQCCPLALQAAVLKLDESEVEQLEPDLQDHYNRLQSLATALGRGFMLYHRVKQASLYHLEDLAPFVGR